MSEPFEPERLRDAACRLPGIDAGAVDALVARGIQFARRLSGPVPKDAYPLLAVSLRAGDESLVLAIRVIEEVSCPELAAPPVLVTMVTTAVLSRPGVDNPVAAVRTVLERGAELAARQPSPENGMESHFSLHGNAHLAWQIAGYRAALDELTGEEPDLDRYVGELAPLATAPDMLRAFAEFLGGEEAFVQLTHTEPDVPELEDVACDCITADSDAITAWLFAELYSGTTAAQRRVVTEWLTGLRSPTSQDDLAFLVDRIRRVERRIERCPATPPGPVDLPEAQQVRGVIGAAVRNSFSFPPLWTDRGAAVNLAAGKLRVQMTRSQTTWPTSMLVASIVVRGLGQEVHRTADPDRPHDCGCGADLRTIRTPQSPDEVCPHRPWPERGRVEDYTTLARTARAGDEHLVQLHLKRYQGLWQEWVGDVRDRMD